MGQLTTTPYLYEYELGVDDPQKQLSFRLLHLLNELLAIALNFSL